jgi:hypothetical protein
MPTPYATYTVDIDAITDGGSSASAIRSNGYSFTVNSPLDLVRIKTWRAGAFIAYSPWGVPENTGPSTGSTHRVSVVRGASNSILDFSAGSDFDGYEAARIAWEAAYPNGATVSGARTYYVGVFDSPIGDNTGGLSLAIEVYAAEDYQLLPLWPRAPLREVLEWMTDVAIFEDGTEERTKLRTAPRQSFEMTYYVPPLLQPRIKNIMYGGRKKPWLIPVWPQVQQVGAVSLGQSSLTCETRYSEFRDGGLIMLWQDPDTYQVLEVDEVTSNTNIDLLDTTEAFTNAYLVPVRRGRLSRDPVRAASGYNSILEIGYAVEENEQLVVSAPTQYDSQDIYTDVGLLEGRTIDETLETAVDIHDEGLGIVSWRTPWTFNRHARVHRAIGETPAETWELREWLHRRAGRYRPFWQPTFEADFKVTSTGALTTTLSVEDNDYLANATDRNHIAVETASGWLFREITGTLDAGSGVTQLTLDTSLGIDAEDIIRVCYLSLKRLDADRLEINWIGGTVCEIAALTLEVYP